MYRVKIPPKGLTTAAAAKVGAAASPLSSSSSHPATPSTATTTTTTSGGSATRTALIASMRHEKTIAQQLQALKVVKDIPFKAYTAEEEGEEGGGEGAAGPSSEASTTTPAASSPSSSASHFSTNTIIPLTHSLFRSLLACPKQFMLERYLSQGDMPQLSEGDRLLMMDGQLFQQLCRQKYTLGVDESTIYRVTSPSYDNALEETASIMGWYFGTYLPSKDALLLPPMTMLMPAFNAFVDPFGGAGYNVCGKSNTTTATNNNNATTATNSTTTSNISFELRSRINILQYNPPTRSWLCHAAQASTDLSAKDKEGLYLKQLFQLYTLRHCADHESFALMGSGGGGRGDNQHNRRQHQYGRFASSFHQLREIAPLFTASLNDAAISVGGGTKRSVSTVNTIHSRMIPLTEDCYSRATLASMINATPAGVLRGAFLSKYSVGGDELMLEAAVHGDALSASAPTNATRTIATAATTPDPFSSNSSSSHDALEFPLTLPSNAPILHDMAIGDYLLQHCSKVIGAVVGGDGDGGRTSATVGNAPSASTLRLQRAFATYDPKPSLAAAMAAIVREQQTGNSTAATFSDGGVSATAPPPGDNTNNTAGMASDCFREACSDCKFFTSGYCKAKQVVPKVEVGVISPPTTPADGTNTAATPATPAYEVFNLPGARTAAKKLLYRNGVRTAVELRDYMVSTGNGANGGGGRSSIFGSTTPTRRAKVGDSLADSSTASTNSTTEALNSSGDLGVRFSDKQQLYIYCAANNLIAINPTAIRTWLSGIRYPMIALDFEATAYALPRYGKMRPYGQLPFQFSSLAYMDDPFAADADEIVAVGSSSVVGANNNNVITTPSPPPPLHTAFCAMGSGYEAKEDPRRRTGSALMMMIEGARAAQQRYNNGFVAAAASAAAGGGGSSPYSGLPISMTINSYIPNITAVGVADDGATAARKARENAAGGATATKKRARKNASTAGDPTTTTSGLSSIQPPQPIGRVRGSTNKYKSDELLIDGIHSTLSKAKGGCKLIIDDPHAHGCIVGHNVSFEKGCFQTIGLQAGEGVGFASSSSSTSRGGGYGYGGFNSRYSRPSPTLNDTMHDTFHSLVFMDTLKLVGDGLIHPYTFGSSSLKKLVPALVPHVGPQYEDLVIADGLAASATYRDWVTAMTQRLTGVDTVPTSSLGSAAIAAAAGGGGQNIATSAPTTPTVPTAPPTPRDYHSYAQQLAALNKSFDERRQQMIDYCNADTRQMVEVVKEVARIARLAERIVAEVDGNGGNDGGAQPEGRKKGGGKRGGSKKNKGTEEVATATPTTTPTASPLPQPQSPTTTAIRNLPIDSRRYVDLGRGWVGIPISAVVATRRRGE